MSKANPHKKDPRSHIWASVVTILVLLLVFLLLWFAHIQVSHIEEDEGIEIAFGDADFGGGNEPLPVAAVPEETTPPPPPPQPVEPSPDDVMTQEDEQSIAAQKAAEEKRKKEQAERAEQERLKREQEARERAEREAEAKRLAEQRAREQEAIDKANQLGGLFGNNPNPSEGSGQTAGDQTAGNPLGHGSSGGNDWSLAGRSLVGNLAIPNIGAGDQTGKVVVTIRVNAEGKVIVANATGGTISDLEVRRACEAAAKRTKFSTGKAEVSGTITYVIDGRSH